MSVTKQVVSTVTSRERTEAARMHRPRHGEEVYRGLDGDDPPQPGRWFVWFDATMVTDEKSRFGRFVLSADENPRLALHYSTRLQIISDLADLLTRADQRLATAKGDPGV